MTVERGWRSHGTRHGATIPRPHATGPAASPESIPKFLSPENTDAPDLEVSRGITIGGRSPPDVEIGPLYRRTTPELCSHRVPCFDLVQAISEPLRIGQRSIKNRLA